MTNLPAILLFAVSAHASVRRDDFDELFSQIQIAQTQPRHSFKEHEQFAGTCSIEAAVSAFAATVYGLDKDKDVPKEYVRLRQIMLHKSYSQFGMSAGDESKVMQWLKNNIFHSSEVNNCIDVTMMWDNDISQADQNARYEHTVSKDYAKQFAGLGEELQKSHDDYHSYGITASLNVKQEWGQKNNHAVAVKGFSSDMKFLQLKNSHGGINSDLAGSVNNYDLARVAQLHVVRMKKQCNPENFKQQLIQWTNKVEGDWEAYKVGQSAKFSAAVTTLTDEDLNSPRYKLLTSPRDENPTSRRDYFDCVGKIKAIEAGEVTVSFSNEPGSLQEFFVKPYELDVVAGPSPGSTPFEDGYNVSHCINLRIRAKPSELLTEMQCPLYWAVKWFTAGESKREYVIAKYGKIEDWNVSGVTTMRSLLGGMEDFDEDISRWDVSSVTTMSCMFKGATAFNQDTSGWNVGSVTTMEMMFRDAKGFNQNICSWGVRSVENMSGMFNGATQFNNGGMALTWGERVKAVKDMSFMFNGAEKFNQKIGDWNVSSVTTMQAMFMNANQFNNDGVALAWGDHVQKVKDMSFMFKGATAFNQKIGDWNVSSVTTMAGMFYGATQFNNDGVALTWGGHVKAVTDMSWMFNGATAFNQDISSWSVSSVTTMAGMFLGATQFNNGGKALTWGDKVRAVKDMSFMFVDGTAFNQDISGWDVSWVTTMKAMFQNAEKFNNGDVALTWGEHVKAVTDMSWMFRDAKGFNQNICSWSVSSVTTMAGMFLGATQFNNGGKALTWGDKVRAVTDMSWMFRGATAFNQKIGDWNVSSVTTMVGMLYGATQFNNDGVPLPWNEREVMMK